MTLAFKNICFISLVNFFHFYSPLLITVAFSTLAPEQCLVMKVLMVYSSYLFFVFFLRSLGLALCRFFFFPALAYFFLAHFLHLLQLFNMTITVHNVPTSVSLQLCTNVKLYPYCHWLLHSFYI